MVNVIEKRKQIASNIRRIRQDREMTQAQAAERVEVNQQTWSKIETGKSAITTDMLYWIAEIFGTSIEYFFREPTRPDANVMQTTEQQRTEQRPLPEGEPRAKTNR